MKKILTIIIIMITIISFTSNRSTVFANESEDNIYFGNEANVYLAEDKFLIGEEVDIKVNVLLSNNIIDYIVTNNGFNISSEILYNDGSIYFSVIHNSQINNPYFKLEILLDNNIILKVELYGYINENDLYVSPYSYEEAYEVYKFYENSDNIGNNNIQDSNMNNLNINEPIINNAAILSNPDTYVECQFYWEDDNNVIHPLRFFKVELWDRNSSGDIKLSEEYTDSSGKCKFSFKNDDSTSEDGGYDVFIRVMPAGEDVTVCRYNNSAYQEDIEYYENIPTGITHKFTRTFTMTDSDYFGKAIQIAQAAIFASKYYEEMKNGDAVDVTIKYPHNLDEQGSFYNDGVDTIYITGASGVSASVPNSYASWDVIMHEYGHHVSYYEGISGNAGSGHSNIAMAEHYKKHFLGEYECYINCSLSSNPSTFAESQCKLKGTTVAWNEGFATYFAIIAQEYYSSYINTIETVCDECYTSYNGLNYSIETNNYGSEDNELTVQCLMYDMYDASGTDYYDQLSLGHSTMWNYITNSNATTLDQFDNYFRSNCSSYVNVSKYGKLLASLNLATYSPNISGTLSTTCPTIGWAWSETNDEYFFTNRLFSVNFYNSSYQLIGSTTPQSFTEYDLTISESLWTQVLNSTNSFYVSITITENNSPITSYESELKLYTKPQPETLLYTSQLSKNLSANQCFWFKFVAPQTEEYVFETTGTTDTYGELFSKMVAGQSITNRIIYNDDGTDSNFKITYLLTKGEVVYLRVRGYEWSETGDFIIKVSSNNHVHIYDYSFSQSTNLAHLTYCHCGVYTSEIHDWMSYSTGYKCRDCGYFTTGPIIVPQNTIIIEKDEQ